MDKISAERMKDKLIAIGKWGDFSSVKASMKKKGIRCCDSEALRVVAPDLMPEFFPVKANKPPSKAVMAVWRDRGDPRVMGNETVAAEVAAGGDEIISSAMFDGKTCSMTEAIQWAYEACEIGGASPYDAPSALAWCLMRDFKKSQNYKFDLFKGIAMAKAKKEEAQEEFGGGNFDGKAEYDILARLGGSEGRVAEVDDGVGVDVGFDSDNHVDVETTEDGK